MEARRSIGTCARLQDAELHRSRNIAVTIHRPDSPRQTVWATRPKRDGPGPLGSRLEIGRWGGRLLRHDHGSIDRDSGSASGQVEVRWSLRGL